MKKESTIFVRIGKWGEIQLDYLVELVKELKSQGVWLVETWKPTPALIDKKGKTSRQYHGQHYDPKYIDLVNDGWDHDHCEICTKTISDKNYEDWVTEGYKYENEWICEECFNLFMITDDIENELKKYAKIEK